ncbi:MAG: exodeoxyribonuclease V subunit gamma, partial [Candidatus Glassbacteria bacterium]|nr:exodeoxyribonuclease V subunit gamma [Candidatus Glassbacteria bacterium]
MKIFTGNKLETLAERLARVLASRPPDALEPEVIVVRSLGMERWVSMELARRLGICANCSFPFPKSFVRDMFGQVLPGVTEEQKSFFDPGVMALKIMQLLPGLLERPAFSGLRAYLGRERQGLKSIQLASRIARVFDQYQLYRPQMILDWNRGNPGPGGRSQPWQFELWREITAGHRGLDRAGLREKFFAWAD